MIGSDALTFELQVCSNWTLSDGSTVGIKFYLPCLNLQSSIRSSSRLTHLGSYLYTISWDLGSLVLILPV